MAKFLKSLIEKRGIAVRDLAAIAGISQSVIYDWMGGSNPSENVTSLKKICNHYGYTLSQALTGEPDLIESDTAKSAETQISALFDEVDFYDGYARIKVSKLVPKKGSK